jgi:hypothetical protein
MGFLTIAIRHTGRKIAKKKHFDLHFTVAKARNKLSTSAYYKYCYKTGRLIKVSGLKGETQILVPFTRRSSGFLDMLMKACLD